MDDAIWLGVPSVALGEQHSVWQWLLGVPWYLYLLALAAVVIALAAWLSARADRSARWRLELEYQRQAAERLQSLRREIYPAAAGALARAQELIAKLPGLDLSRDTAQGVIDQVVEALGRVHLVGSEETLRATTAVTAAFDAAFLALAAQRRPVVELQNEIDGIDIKVRHLSYERDQLMSSITRLAGDGVAQHAALWGEMNMRFDKLHREIGNLMKRRGEKVSALTAAQRAYALEAAQQALKLAKLSVPAFLALRAELGVAIDETDYRLLAQRTIGEIERHCRLLAEASSAPARVGESKAQQSPAQPPQAEGGGAESPDHAHEQPHETRLRMVLKKN